MLIQECKDGKSIAVVGDDRQLRGRVANILAKIGYCSQLFMSIEDRKLSCIQLYAVVVITDHLGNISPEALENMAHFDRLILISRVADEKHVVGALYGGAHFVFDILEPDKLLSIRLQAALRSHGEKMLSSIFVPPFKFDVRNRRVYLGNKPISLSPKEYQFAEYIFSRPETVVAKSELMLSVWSLSPTIDARRVDTAACRVRKKMSLGSHNSGWELQYQRNRGFKLSHMESELSCI